MKFFVHLLAHAKSALIYGFLRLPLSQHDKFFLLLFFFFASSCLSPATKTSPATLGDGLNESQVDSKTRLDVELSCKIAAVAAWSVLFRCGRENSLKEFTFSSSVVVINWSTRGRTESGHVESSFSHTCANSTQCCEEFSLNYIWDELKNFSVVLSLSNLYHDSAGNVDSPTQSEQRTKLKYPHWKNIIKYEFVSYLIHSTLSSPLNFPQFFFSLLFYTFHHVHAHRLANSSLASFFIESKMLFAEGKVYHF